jgi:hypothetical protein
MKSNELRIGNYILISVLSDNGNFEYEMFKVNSTTIRDAERYGDEWNAEPIALTEEWLLKFGARKVNHIHGYVFWTFHYTKSNNALIDIYKNYTEVNSRLVNNCKYVHQLQNLYFALTGNELELK